MATSGTHFMLAGKFYNQIDGAAMWSRMSPGLTNGELWMKVVTITWKVWSTIVSYIHELYDLSFNSESDTDNFVFLNQQHLNINFIDEKQTYNQLSFFLFTYCL